MSEDPITPTSPINFNPFVRHFSDEDLDTSEDNNSTSVASYNVESSTSCSTTGFTHITSPVSKNVDYFNKKIF